MSQEVKARQHRLEKQVNAALGEVKSCRKTVRSGVPLSDGRAKDVCAQVRCRPSSTALLAQLMHSALVGWLLQVGGMHAVCMAERISNNSCSDS